MSWIDVHTHLSMLEGDAAIVIAAAKSQGVNKMITIGTGHDDHPKIVDLVNKHSSIVYGTLGFHPHEAKDFNEAGEKFMRGHLTDPGIVAVGEIGLDFFYNHSDHDTQKRAFRRQMELAAEFGLPVEIHSRDAEPETIEILKEFSGRVRGLMHCFTGTQWLADQALAIGYNISISGVVTFKGAGDLRAVVKTVPLNRLHIETDAPFLTPVPFRGKKNEPALMVHTAQVVADVKGISIDELAQATTQNAFELFKKLI